MTSKGIRGAHIVHILALCLLSAFPASAVTMEERITAALASTSSRAIAEKLKHIPDGTFKKEQVIAHLNDVRKQEAEAAKNKAAADADAARKQAQIDAANQKKAAANRKVALVELRERYETVLRDKFLDDGFDIQVSVWGPQNTKLTLKYALFNDVWVHKFKKGALIQQLHDIGFKTIEFRDGYNYATELTFR